MKRSYEETVEELIKDINAADKAFSFQVKIGKPEGTLPLYRTEEERAKLVRFERPTETNFYRTIKVYAHDLTTRERILLYQDNYVASKAASFLRGDYREALCKNLLFHSLYNLNLTLIDLRDKKKQEIAANQPQPEPQPVASEAGL